MDITEFQWTKLRHTVALRKKTQYFYFDSKDALVASIIEKELLKEKEDFVKLYQSI